MARVKVSSSNVEAVGYMQDVSILEVEFKGGSIYHYYDVPLIEHKRLMEAESVGKYLNEHIKPKFRYEKVS